VTVLPSVLDASLCARRATSCQVVCEMGASSSPDLYAASAMAITSSASGAGGESTLATDSALM